MPPTRPLILLSNDDGVLARNLQALHDALSTRFDVVVVAPEREQSANSHALTLTQPLRHREVAPNIHAIEGTPADCVYVALHHGSLLPRVPDLVVSGINHGVNLGTDVYYSGTVAAAREAVLRGVPAIAFSLATGGDPALAASISLQVVVCFLEVVRPTGAPAFLNVNFPSTSPKGIRVGRAGGRAYADAVTLRKDPRGREYFWLGGDSVDLDTTPGTDTHAIHEGYASITPLSIDPMFPAHLDLAGAVASAATSWVLSPSSAVSSVV